MADSARIEAYLAGPDVFYPDALERAARKKDVLRPLGILGHFPLDNEVPPELFAEPEQAADHIAKANEQLMLTIVRRSEVAILFANMSPFHGPSMDVGTAFEVGFMSALAETNDHVLLVGYTESDQTFEDRVVTQEYQGRAEQDADGILRGPDGLMIEAFGQADNLMITHAIRKAHGQVFRSFTEAAQYGSDRATDILATNR